jgi:hypothetical protein
VAAPLRRLTSSYIGAYQRCPRKSYLAYAARIRPLRRNPDLWFGTVVHRCLEAYWRARMAMLALDDAALALFVTFVTESADLDPYQAAKMKAMLVLYVSRWALVPCRVLAVEAQFEYPLINPESGMRSRRWKLAGKIDVIIELTAGFDTIPAGAVCIVEHKTSADDLKDGGAYRSRLKHDHQVSQYFVGAAALGFDCDFCIYDVLRKPTQKPLKATGELKYNKDGSLRKGQRVEDETPEQYFERCAAAIRENPDAFIVRVVVVRFGVAHEDYEFTVWQVADAIAQSERLNKAPQHRVSCWLFHKPCEYLPICDGYSSPDDQTMYRIATSEHEELDLEPAGEGEGAAA